MRLIFATTILLFVSTLSYAQEQREFEMTEGDTTYVMKKYFMVFLNSGPNRSQSKAEADSLQVLHLAHIDKLAAEGKVILAGPFGDDGDKRGILLFDVDTKEEALELEGADPMVVAGRLTMEVHPWWGAKGTCLK